MSGGNLWEVNNEVAKVSIECLRIAVTPLTVPQTVAIATNGRGKRLLLNHNLHSAYLHDTDPKFRALYRDADWIIVDGAPILWLASKSVRQRFGPEYRVGSTDWLSALPSSNERKRLFVFGASADSNSEAIYRLRRSLPQWAVSGVDGYVEDGDAVTRISQFRPDLVIIGLGMPRQEHFLLTNFANLPNATYATVGGAIDYLAGTKRLAPRWVGHIGMEWAWRLAHEPRRLAYRYLIEPLKLVGRIVARRMLQRRSGRSGVNDET